MGTTRAGNGQYHWRRRVLLIQSTVFDGPHLYSGNQGCKVRLRLYGQDLRWPLLTVVGETNYLVIHQGKQLGSVFRGVTNPSFFHLWDDAGGSLGGRPGLNTPQSIINYASSSNSMPPQIIQTT